MCDGGVGCWDVSNQVRVRSRRAPVHQRPLDVEGLQQLPPALLALLGHLPPAHRRGGQGGGGGEAAGGGRAPGGGGQGEAARGRGAGEAAAARGAVAGGAAGGEPVVGLLLRHHHRVPLAAAAPARPGERQGELAARGEGGRGAGEGGAGESPPGQAVTRSQQGGAVWGGRDKVTLVIGLSS